MSVTPYADVSAATTYFSERLGTESWDAADSNTKLKALKHATTDIDTLAFIGSKTSSTQAREFPRNGDTAIPAEVAAACCEQALALLNGLTIERAGADRRLASRSVGDASESYRDGIDILSENSGLTSATAARILSPWLLNPTDLKIERNG